MQKKYSYLEKIDSWVGKREEKQKGKMKVQNKSEPEYQRTHSPSLLNPNRNLLVYLVFAMLTANGTIDLRILWNSLIPWKGIGTGGTSILLTPKMRKQKNNTHWLWNILPQTFVKLKKTEFKAELNILKWACWDIKKENWETKNKNGQTGKNGRISDWIHKMKENSKYLRNV